jgi:hypothetical protein
VITRHQRVKDDIYHVEGISHQGKRMDGETSDKLEEEKGDIDGQHNADPRRFGPRHLESRCRTRRLKDEAGRGSARRGLTGSTFLPGREGRGRRRWYN